MKTEEGDILKIKKIFSQLDKESKDEVRTKISNKFKITIDVAKNHWIYGGNIPEANVKGVLKIVVAVLNKQIEKMQELI